MSIGRKQVLCTDCGFFCWEFYRPEDGSRTKLVELPTYWRNRIQTTKDLGSLEDHETGEGTNPLCLRRQWFFAPHIRGSRLDHVGVDELAKLRKCTFYIKYQPSFSPEEHKELLRDVETRRTVFAAALLGAAIGASAAILAQILYILIS